MRYGQISAKGYFGHSLSSAFGGGSAASSAEPPVRHAQGSAADAPRRGRASAHGRWSSSGPSTNGLIKRPVMAAGRARQRSEYPSLFMLETMGVSRRRGTQTCLMWWCHGADGVVL